VRYHFFRLVSVFAPRIPWRLRPFVATLVGLMAWLLARSARAGASQNAMHVLGLTNTETRQQRRRLRRVVKGMFITAARNYLEVCAFSGTSPQQLLSHLMSNPDFSALDAALAPGKGAILISAHFGPFDYVAQCLQLHGYPLTIPVEQLSDQRMLDLMLSLRRRYGVQYVCAVAWSFNHTHALTATARAAYSADYGRSCRAGVECRGVFFQREGALTMGASCASPP